MKFSKKHTSAVLAFAVLFLITVVSVVFILKCAGPVKRGMFTRCDGIDEPIDEIKIDACPDWPLLGYCEISQISAVSVTLELFFTPGKFNVLSRYSRDYS